jgi:hypothetical protein
MAYANLNDANVFLASDRLQLTDATFGPLELDAERIIRGYVGGIVDATKLASWASPEVTPEIIRMIAGRLIASAYYVRVYSENSLDIPEYAQNLYNIAIGYLQGIQKGSQVIIEIDGSTIDIVGTALTSSNFQPNDSSTPPAFTREMIFG